MNAKELYREVILDHSRHPRHNRQPANHTHTAHCKNPICGDEVTLYLSIDNIGNIADIAFQGQGCAISTASASLMCQRLHSKHLAEAKPAQQQLDNLLNCTQTAETITDLDNFDELQALQGISQLPDRKACALLPWQALQQALKSIPQPPPTT